jgi:hypothetical protein
VTYNSTVYAARFIRAPLNARIPWAEHGHARPVGGSAPPSSLSATQSSETRFTSHDLQGTRQLSVGQMRSDAFTTAVTYGQASLAVKVDVLISLCSTYMYAGPLTFSSHRH